jgi:tRNA dimethylallyltransferase
MLREIDPESADAIHQNNVKRVIRAIEIYRTGGVKKSELDRRSLECESEYDALVIALRYNNREILYNRIDSRVDAMIQEGLLGETESLWKEGIFEKNTTASQAIGYKEMLGYIKGETSLEEAISTLKTATRRYAKRQMTWFSSKSYVRWIDADIDEKIRPFEDILADACELMRGFGIEQK